MVRWGHYCCDIVAKWGHYCCDIVARWDHYCCDIVVRWGHYCCDIVARWGHYCCDIVARWGHYSHAVTWGQYYVMHCTVTHMQSDSLGYTLFTVCVSSSCSPSLSNGRQYNAMLVCVEGLHLQRGQLFSGWSYSCTADTLSDTRTCTHARTHTCPPTHLTDSFKRARHNICKYATA